MNPDERWKSVGVTQAFLNEKAEWMSRDLGFPGTVIMYFRTAGSLIRFSWFDYTLVSAAFFHAVVGLEGVLRLIYEADQRTSFKSLLDRAVTNAAISDAVFSDIRPLPKSLSDLVGKGEGSYAERLAARLPSLRNGYLHGGYRLSPAFLWLAMNVREAVDAVWSVRERP